jgi:tetratricopeptide (TPR) repeat protein
LPLDFLLKRIRFEKIKLSVAHPIKNKRLKLNKQIITFVFLLFCCFAIAQNKKNDSLWAIYNNKSQPDTNRLKAIHAIAWNYNSNNPDTAIILSKLELNLADSLPFEKGKKWVAKALNIMGASYTNKGNYPKALEYYLKTLKIREEIGDKQGVGTCYNNIGVVYQYQNNCSKALEYYLKVLKIREEIADKQGIGSSYTNIGNVYYYQSDFNKALEYYLKALKINEVIADKHGIADCYGNIGAVYNDLSDFTKALDYDLKSLKMRELDNDEQGIGTCFINMGGLYYALSNYKMAISYFDSALQIGKKISDIDNERIAYKNISSAYNKIGKYKEAYENHVKFKTLTDSIFNADNSKQLGDLKTKFEVEKKETELKVKSEAEQEKLKAVSLEEKKRQQVIIHAVAGVLLLVVVFSLFLLNRFRITQKQKQVIEEQKVLVDKAYEQLHEKNKEVIDSITYARRIQTALLPTEKYIEKSLTRLMKNN